MQHLFQEHKMKKCKMLRNNFQNVEITVFEINISIYFW
jgi:hypothetical protein